MKKRNLIISILSAAAALGLAAGGTFALFTSNESVNIAVTSGKINVSATVENIKTYSGEWDDETSSYKSLLTPIQGTFINGGTASVDADGTVILDKICPMDKVTFDIVIKNNSNVAIKQRTGFSKVSDNGLYNGLTIKINDAIATEEYTNWETVSVGSDDVIKHVSIELPELAGNEYQEKTCEVSFTVEAVQGNANVVNQINASSNQEIKEALSNIDENTEIVVASSEDTYTLPKEVGGKTVTIVGEDRDTTKFNRNTAQELPNVELTMNNVTLVGGTSDYVGFQHTGTETYINCKFTGKTFFYASETTFIDCEFVQETYEYCFWLYGKGTYKFENCTFNTKGKAAKVYSESSTASDIFDVTFNNCEFNSSENSHNKPAIAVDSRGATYNIFVNECTTTNFNCNDDAMASWYETRMASATTAQKCLVGAENQIEHITATIDGDTF